MSLLRSRDGKFSQSPKHYTNETEASQRNVILPDRLKSISRLQQPRCCLNAAGPLGDSAGRVTMLDLADKLLVHPIESPKAVSVLCVFSDE